uniref:Uncharacterized protein n=1 Tax=Anguilla anguilla TaxID=7936 RepID=A0A0E9V1T7_ANGAN
MPFLAGAEGLVPCSSLASWLPVCPNQINSPSKTLWVKLSSSKVKGEEKERRRAEQCAFQGCSSANQIRSKCIYCS